MDDKNALDDKGRSAMHVACAQWHSGDEAKALMMIKYLVQDVQCDVHIVDVEGKLPEDHMVYKPSRITDDKWERQHEREMEARCERMKKQVINILEVGSSSIWLVLVYILRPNQERRHDYHKYILPSIILAITYTRE